MNSYLKLTALMLVLMTQSFSKANASDPANFFLDNDASGIYKLILKKGNIRCGKEIEIRQDFESETLYFLGTNINPFRYFTVSIEQQARRISYLSKGSTIIARGLVTHNPQVAGDPNTGIEDLLVVEAFEGSVGNYKVESQRFLKIFPGEKMEVHVSVEESIRKSGGKKLKRSKLGNCNYKRSEEV